MVGVFLFFAARVAFGVEVILGAFIRGTKRPLKELHVLDAGMYTIVEICSLVNSSLSEHRVIALILYMRL